CEDEHANCGTWAAQGECQSNPGYMLERCKVACDVCDGEEGGGGVKECKDTAEYCGPWANLGYCGSGSRFAEYMKQNCAKTCGYCTGGNGGGGGGAVTCSDGHANCAYWTSIGECSRNPAWMLENCKKSCRQC
ncbi:hypothetical protein CAPTEDRAFT_185959, partial [Capitella teleta]